MTCLFYVFHLIRSSSRNNNLQIILLVNFHACMEHIKCHRTLLVGWSFNISRAPHIARNYTLNIFVILSTSQDMSMYKTYTILLPRHVDLFGLMASN